ncbi:F390 synthetase-related protein [Paenibacillus bovis]|uniref:Adenylate cyclase n=1 Tax=Paenibacillus bovis TaxID=1616788 RepID=A0A172ZEC9_9BACL|nr:F390 synthetase-related protein [Paenibacillus bovis]ANF95510.1 hypothetical protein AR543_05465 [Paenibacillus bovis]
MNSDTLRILYHYMQTRHLHRWSGREALERWQERRIIRQIRRIRAVSAFYRDLWKGLPDHAWRQFPIIDKQIMMEHFDRLNTVGIRCEEAMKLALQAEQTRDFQPLLNGVTVGLSSGTSGNRGLFLVSPQEQAAWTGTVLAKLLPGGLKREARIAFFLRANSNLYESVRKGKLQFRYFDLMCPLEEHLEQMNQYRPTIWVAPASMLRLLAEEYAAGRLNVQPQRIIAVAEVLDPLDQQYIEQTFEQTVHQVYQCTEGFLGATCAHGTIHLNEDLVCIEKEYIDRDSRRFMPIITDFSRITQPIIRYRLNDILTESAAPCLCGSPFTAIERIEGRYDDILYIRHNQHHQKIPLFPDLVTRAIIAASPHISHYRVIQQAEDRLEIAYRLTDTDEASAVVEQSIQNRIETICQGLHGIPPHIRFTAYDFTPGPVKLRRVERRWNI